MPEKLISGDNHIDLTYLPPDLWSSDAPNKWKLSAPRVEEMEDGLHWFVEAQDKGMWNGIGPGFLPYQKGMFGHIDEMKDVGFEWSSKPGAKPRPTTPELRLADLDRDGQDAEIIYGCLMINDLIADAPLRAWADQTYNDWVADFAKRADPNRVYPAGDHPQHRPGRGGGRGAALRQAGIARRRPRLQADDPAALHRSVVPAVGGRGRVPVPDLVPFDRVQGVARPRYPEQEQKYLAQWRLVRSALFQLDTMEVLVSLLASGACERYPDFNFVLGESGVTWLPYVFDRLDTEYADRARSLNFKLKPSDYFRRQGYVTYQQDQFLEPIIPLIGEDNIIWGADYPHPDCIWPGSRATLDRNMAEISPAVRRKITSENVTRLYQLHQ